jgi:hypothetical protein
MTSSDFAEAYSVRLRKLGVTYKTGEFLYPHNAPWPEQSFDYPYGQAPTVSNVPPDEAADWDTYIGSYYRNGAIGTIRHPTPFGIQSAEFARRRFAENGISGYAPVSDEEFVNLTCEGLYSKFLGLLDPADEELFGVRSDDAHYQYLKFDVSCMRVVKKPWEGEYVAPAIALVRRRLPIDERTRYKYELRAIALARPDGAGDYAFRQDLVFSAEDHGEHSAWWLAKYYVLQGAIHRINLVDHIKVHFPSDTINSVTKATLPRWHLLQQLLLPHFWLTLPVNNAVLEGDRSIINRDTWYPWSPVVARGDEIRKLIPLSWGGASYSWDGSNSAYPHYRFSLEIESTPNPASATGATPTFIGLEVSRYAKYLKDYFPPILAFARGVIALLPDPDEKTKEGELAWLEIERWAHEIARLVPGFPDEHAIRNKETLASVCAVVIWNAAVVHSADHSTLHTMIDRYPVPFILRVPPPKSNDVTVELTIEQAIGEKGVEYLKGALRMLEKVTVPPAYQPIVERVLGPLLGLIGELKLTEGSVPLCWPTDLVYTKMADLLFYRPHNTTLLYDCAYEFLARSPEQKSEEGAAAREREWREAGRPVVDDATRGTLSEVRRVFQEQLREVNERYYDQNGEPVQYGSYKASDTACVLNGYGFPKLIPGKKDTDVAGARTECCLSAGVQY